MKFNCEKVWCRMNQIRKFTSSEDKMRFVIDIARKALDQGELPIAAAIFLGDELIHYSHTSEQQDKRYLVHAEQKVLLEVDQMGFDFKSRKKLELYTNLEPCLMCLGMAISCAIGEIYYSVEAVEDGAVDFVKKEYDTRTFGTSNPFTMPQIVKGLLRDQSIGLFREFVERYSDGMGVEFARSIYGSYT